MQGFSCVMEMRMRLLESKSPKHRLDTVGRCRNPLAGSRLLRLLSREPERRKKEKKGKDPFLQVPICKESDIEY
jgi:hypothetical protein